MYKTIIHLSDLHFRQNWEEDQDVVLGELFKDLGKQIRSLDKSSVYIAFSGDVVLAGSEPDLYDKFFLRFDDELNKLYIPKNQRICVPGNHDVSRKIISDNLVEHEGVVSQRLSEREFNDYASRPDGILTKKFGNYLSFESRFAGMGVSRMVSGAGWNLGENIGVYCLNSALCSSGGLSKDGSALLDEGRLAINTRDLQKWNLSCKANTKILVMHHPLSWLIEWAQVELKNILDKNFSLSLSGHDHNQDALYSIHNDSSLVKCSAPPLLTNKDGDLGYSMIRVEPDEGVIDIVYRQWTKHRTFVSGVNFSDTDDGVIRIKKSEDKTEKVGALHGKTPPDFLGLQLNRTLEDALQSFSTQPIIWVEPILKKVSESSSVTKPQLDLEPCIVLSDFISNPKSTIIKAPPQFGLTCLAHYFRKEAWCNKGEYWIYLDSDNVKTHSIEKSIQVELQTLGCEISDVKCIILDSWSSREKKPLLLLQKLCNLYEDIPIIVMHTVNDARALLNIDADMSQFSRAFEVLYLWALSRSGVRKIVTEYNNATYIGDVDSVITKITSDLEVLNLPRTPLNCLTLLKASEVDFDESPVNRTELIDRILFILFNMDHLPTFKVRPDLKDCEYVLGYFCETMMRQNSYSFTQQHFLKQLQAFCDEKVLDLDVQVVFDILYHNSILVERGGLFCFRFTYWIFYFIAQRMHHDETFAKYILADMRYASFPEIIEFYTGIDRRREDALGILVEDIQAITASVDEKLGFPMDLNPYKFAQWNPSQASLEKVQNALSDGVKESHLPDSVKDQYADRNYDRVRPYHQEIQNIFQGYSLATLVEVTTAGARALRNSDYADPVIKRSLLDAIMGAIEQLSKVIIVLSPILAIEGNVVYDGARINLVGPFGDSPEMRLNNILSSIPHSIISRFQNDLFSRKMGPLLIDRLNSETTDLIKHNLVLLLIAQRPREWKAQVQNYIASVSKNSFYLMDVHRVLLDQYVYSYASYKTLEDIKYLVKMVAVKHEYGVKAPGVKEIGKVSDKVLPPRKSE